MKTDILILNYNGKLLMEDFLPSICDAARKSSDECSVHVVDNQSTDGSVEMLKAKFPEVKVHVAEVNRVLCSYNDIVKILESDVVLFLNNDIKVEPDFVDHLVKHFGNPEVMFVAPCLLNFDGTYNGGRSHIRFHRGAIKVVVDEQKYSEFGDTQAISTGAFRRNIFLELGGFDDLYLPGIWEDVDICFRGLALGWKGIYEPKSIIWHDESTTFNKEYGQKGKLRIAHRNMFLFFWRNITDVRMFAIHVLLTLPRIIVQYLLGKRENLEGFIMALKKIPLVLMKRRALKAEWRKKTRRDRSVIV